jgi:hypothetical protein
MVFQVVVWHRSRIGMRSKDGLRLLAINSGVAIVAMAGMLVVLWALDPDLETNPTTRPFPASAPSTTVARLSSRSPAQLAERSDKAPRLPPAAVDSEGSGTWSTETRGNPESEDKIALRTTLPPDIRRDGSYKQYRRLVTVRTRLAQLSPAANFRVAARFAQAGMVWPPAELTLIAIKDEKTLELHARHRGEPWRLVHRYRILAASGRAGPKLRQGDRQVPEGIYAFASLNPNSAYHVSLRVDYPNAFDRLMAQRDGRTDLGGDIMIHGKNLSAGCLAMGDEVAEELFVIVAQIGLPNVKLIIAPTDFRNNATPVAAADSPAWVANLYAELTTAMREYKAPPKPGLLSLIFK